MKRLLKRLRLRLRLLGNPAPRIVVGASGHFPPGWVPTDISTLNLLHEADWQRWFVPGSLAAIFAEHVWEHLDFTDGLRAARFCYRYLRPGGYLRLAVPDGYHPDPAYRELVRPGGSGPGAQDHRVLYTWRSLTGMLTQAGFSVELLEYFDPHGIFHQQPWNPARGIVRRSARFDPRNRDGRLVYTSLIVDAVK